MELPSQEVFIMVRTCKICGTPVHGKNQYCETCKKQKRNQYFKTRYHNDESFRKKHLKMQRNQKDRKQKLGSLYNYSSHPNPNPEDEQRIVTNMKNKTFNRSKNKKNDDSYGYKANKNYKQAKSHEQQAKESKKVCECCGGTEFEIERGMIVCTTCGLCEDIFPMSVFGNPPLSEDDKLTIALREHFKGGNNRD